MTKRSISMGFFAALVVTSASCAVPHATPSASAGAPEIKYYERAERPTAFAGCALPPAHDAFEPLRCRALDTELQCVYETQIEYRYYEVAIAKHVEQCDDAQAWQVIGIRPSERKGGREI